MAASQTFEFSWCSTPVSRSRKQCSRLPLLLVSLCGNRLVAGAILNDVGAAKKQLTHAYVVPLMCHGMLRRDVKVAHTTLQW